MIRPYHIQWLAAIAIVLSGCYSFTGSGLPAGLRTVEIPSVIDNARQPELADQATKAIVDEFARNGALRPLDRDAQSRVDATLSLYSHAPQTFDASGNVSRFRVTVTLEAKFVDLRDDGVLFDSKNGGGGIAGTYDYDPLRETEADAKIKALNVSVRKLVDNTISGW
ncbi:MAG: hypothetical protein RL173_834 [Fibrobacterota bacterium]|jgi:hypothetical protein